MAGKNKQTPGELRLQKGEGWRWEKGRRMMAESENTHTRSPPPCLSLERAEEKKNLDPDLVHPKRPAFSHPPTLPDLSELNLSSGISVTFPDGRDKPMRFEIAIAPDDGLYRGGRFRFEVTVSGAYPHDPPKVKCRTKVFHPNIDTEGNVCLNILREDWKPVLSINSILYGLQFLFLDPNPDDPLNKEAAAMQVQAPRDFERAVAQTVMRGGMVGREYFPPARPEK